MLGMKSIIFSCLILGTVQAINDHSADSDDPTSLQDLSQQDYLPDQPNPVDYVVVEVLTLVKRERASNGGAKDPTGHQKLAKRQPVTKAGQDKPTNHPNLAKRLRASDAGSNRPTGRHKLAKRYRPAVNGTLEEALMRDSRA
ncbi:hypothetical protein FBEOM_10574 [Fusarium beomiforme]|uniref:Uncharacterized protein n=1 Tax=Fusarium beomiforme TaxID=44412 RepID=A0A9P5ABA2_9HYPO|nr:hypothetical protein FBEOM_10574 [Fusarium beomiforme]